MSRIPVHRAWKLETPSNYNNLSEEDKAFLKAFNAVFVFNDFIADIQDMLDIELTDDQKRELFTINNEAQRCCMNVSTEEVAKEHRKTSKNPTKRTVATTQRHLDFLDSKQLLEIDEF